MHQLCVFYWSEIKYYINKIGYIKYVALLLLFACAFLCNEWMNLNCKVTSSVYSPQQMWSHRYIKMSFKSVMLMSRTPGQIRAESMAKAITFWFKFKFWWIIMEACNVFLKSYDSSVISHTTHWCCRLTVSPVVSSKADLWSLCRDGLSLLVASTQASTEPF